MNTLIKDARILAMTGEKIERGNILIEDGVITYIGDEVKEHDQIIEAGGNLVMPGLVNAHTHIAMSVLRNYADDLPFWPWLTERIWPAEEKLDANIIYEASRLSIAEMLLGGVTSFADMYFFMDQTAKAALEMGIRCNLSRGIVASEDSEIKLAESVEFFNNYNGAGGGLIKVDFGPHAPYTTNEDLLQKIKSHAESLDAGVHIHVSESVKEVQDSYIKYDMSPVRYLESIGTFDSHVIAAHCVQLSDEDIEILKNKKVNVVNNPSSNMKLGNGFARVKELLEAGVNVALGTDGPASNNNQDIFEEMHMAALVNKGATLDSTAVRAYEVLKMGTINGAMALGIDDKVGTVEIGKEADLILVDLGSPHMRPLNNIISSLVYSAKSSDVLMTMVKGKIVMSDGKVHGCDIDEVIERVETFRKENYCES